MTPLFGSIERHPQDSTLTMHRTVRTSCRDLWDAIVTPERAARWMGEITGSLQQGGTYRIVFDPSDPDAVVEGQIRVCIPGSELEVTWQAPREEPSVVRATLTPNGDQTELTLVHSQLAPPSSDSGHAAGWQVHLDQLIGGLEHDDWSDRWHSWAGLQSAYESATPARPS